MIQYSDHTRAASVYPLLDQPFAPPPPATKSHGRACDSLCPETHIHMK